MLRAISRVRLAPRAIACKWRRSPYMVLVNGLAVASAFALFKNPAFAQSQIVPDNSLGISNSTVTPNVEIKGVPSVAISGGVVRGTNLLHSFQEFNVDVGRGAYFLLPSGVENVLTRVTGVNPSQILGTLGITGGNANLFLMNPNGIIFGFTARLDVMGSFVGTTANAVRLGNGEIFSTKRTEPLPSQLLNVNPNAFLFNQISHQAISGIQVNGASLSVGEGKSLVLLGGDISLNAANVWVSDGQIELGGLAGAGTVELLGNANHLNLHFSENIQKSDVSLTNNAKVEVTGTGQGSVIINAKDINIFEGSLIFAGISSKLSATGSTSQDIKLNAAGSLTINQNSQIKNEVEPDAIGNAGNINISAKKVNVNGGQIRTRTLGQGNAGNISIKAGEILVDNPPYTLQDENGQYISEDKAAIDASNDGIFASGSGRGGNIYLEADGAIALIGRGNDTQNKVISTYTNGNGRGGSGSVFIKANGSVSLDNAFIVTSSFNGNAGEILLQSDKSISLTNNSSLVATSFVTGDSGNITLKSSDSVRVENSLISANIGAAQNYLSARGNAGKIYLSGKSIFVTAGSEITTRNALGGNAGTIQVDATDLVEISGRVPELFSENNRSGTALYSTLLTSAEENASGQAGDITINVPNGTLRVADGASLRAESQGNFQGGTIAIDAKRVELTGGGKLLTSASRSGDAGNINISATDRIDISGSNPNFEEIFNQTAIQYESKAAAEIRLGTVGGASGIYASTSEMSTAKSGNINIRTGQLSVRDGAQISVSSGQKDAGNLEILSRSIFLDNGGKLRASTASGEGGDIKLQVQDSILMRRQSQISADAGNNGNGGNINIEIPNGFIIGFSKEDSDIIANAQQGKGGRIIIISSGIYGFENRSLLTSLSDINASSDVGLDGTVQIELLGIEPNLAHIDLPTEIVQARLNQSCQDMTTQEESRFVTTGRGGVPSNPYEMLSDEAAIAHWITLVPNTQVSPPATTLSPKYDEVLSKSIVEATGWAIDPQGHIVLTATPTIVPSASPTGTASCKTRLLIKP
jgi:filamentous hemagglutinin family protein